MMTMMNLINCFVLLLMFCKFLRCLPLSRFIFIYLFIYLFSYFSFSFLSLFLFFFLIISFPPPLSSTSQGNWNAVQKVQPRLQEFILKRSKEIAKEEGRGGREGEEERVTDDELHCYVTACLNSLRRGLQVGELPPGFIIIILFYFILFYFILFYFILFYFILFYFIFSILLIYFSFFLLFIRFIDSYFFFSEIASKIKEGHNLSHTFLKCVYSHLFRFFKIVMETPPPPASDPNASPFAYKVKVFVFCFLFFCFLFFVLFCFLFLFLFYFLSLP